MSAISQKSISGITSITTPAGVDNVFTVHTNDTTERFRVDSNGNQVIAGILTVAQDLDVDGHTNLDNVSVAGVSTFSGVSNFNSNVSVSGNLNVAQNIVHTGDTDTKIEFLNNNICFDTAGVERVRIKSDGSIGINSTSPGALLDLSSSQPGILFSETDVSANNGKWLNQANASELYWQAQTDAHSGGGNLFKMTRSNEQIQTFEAQQSGVSWFTIRNSNKTVGIGTNSPAKALEVTSNTVPQFQVGMSNNSARASLMHNGSHLYFDTTSGDQVFRTGSTSEKLRITSAGNVGINTSSLNHIFEVHALGNDANNLQQIVFEKKSSANNKQAFGLTIRSNAQNSSGNEPTAFLRFDARPSSLNGSHGGNAIIAFSPIGVTQGTYGKGNLDFYIRSGGTYTFQNDPGGAGEMQPKLRIDPEGRVMMGGATSAHGSTNRDDLVIGAVNQGNQTGITIGSATASGISFADAGNDTAGGIYYSHGNDDMIFYAGGNQRGKIYDNAGITGIEHHRFIPFLIGYDVQNTENITMRKGFGGMSQLPMNADGDKAYMSYVTHWRHREYAGVYFWYGASGNTSGATFDWDFTVWNASSGSGYSASSHTFTIQSGTMSNGKMYRLNALSSWPTHAAAKFVQFEIEYDELQNGTSLQLSGMELAEYTTP